MDMKVDGDAMRALVTKAIFDSFDEGMRTKLVQTAIESLLTGVDPPSGRYGEKHDKRTFLQKMFDDAVAYVSRDIVRELIEGEYREKIRDLCRVALDKALADEDRIAGVASEVASAISKGLRGGY